jgi:hypothetical protein
MTAPPTIISNIRNRMQPSKIKTGPENRDYSHRDPSRWPRDTPLAAKADTNFTDKRRSLGLYSSLRTKDTELVSWLVTWRQDYSCQDLSF